MPCRCILPVFSPSSVMNQCLTDFFVFFVFALAFSLLQVYILNLCLFSCCLTLVFILFVAYCQCPECCFSGLFFISSLSLITHSRFLAFRHSIHLPHFAGTNNKRLSSQTGALKLFFCLVGIFCSLYI